MISRLILTTLLALPLAGCDLAELLADPRVAQREADGKAIGGACRHAVRSIEACYNANEKASKTAIFAGWKEMDQYMRENKIEGQPAVMAKAEPEEVVMDDKKAKTTSKDKMAADGKPKTNVAGAAGGAAKAAAPAAAH